MPVSINNLCPTLIFEILLRFCMVITFIILETIPPFVRKIHPEEHWQYMYPETHAYVTGSALFSFIFIVPTILIFLAYMRMRDRNDVSEGFLGFTLLLGLTGVITDIIKLAVGRPRPSYFARCFDGGKFVGTYTCKADTYYIWDGRKSFPSGHASFAFASMTYSSLYIAGKLQIFSTTSRLQGGRICLFLLPLICAVMIAISRTCDYHHHWEDVVVGSMLGISLAVICYRQYFPSISSEMCHLCYLSIDNLPNRKLKLNNDELTELIHQDQPNKWI